MQMVESFKSLNNYAPELLLKTLEKNVFMSDFEKAVYSASELDLFSFTKYNYEQAENIRTCLFNQLMVIYMKNIYNPYIWENLNDLFLELEQLRQNRINTDRIDKYSLESCNVRKREMVIICNIINMYCKSYKSMDNVYYKFCLYNFNKLNEEEKITLKKKFVFFEDIDFNQYLEYISYTPSRQPEYIINLVGELKMLCKNFIGALEQKNDIAIYFAHCISNYENIIPSFFNSFPNSTYLLFDLINFVFVNEKSEYIKYIDIAKSWYDVLPSSDNYLCWQTLILFFIKDSKVPNIIVKELDDEQCRQSYLKNVSFIKLSLKSSFNVRDIEDIYEPYSKSEYKKAFLYYKNNKNDNIYDYYDYDCEEYLKTKLTENDYAQYIAKVSDNSYVAEKDKNLILIKGPYDKYEKIKKFIDIQEAKRLLGIKILDYEIVFLIPKKQYKPMPFIVFDMNNVFNGNFSIKNNTVDWSKFENILNKEYITKNKIFNYIFGIKSDYIYNIYNIYNINDDEEYKDESKNVLDISFIKDNSKEISEFFLKLKINKKITNLIKTNKLVELIRTMEEYKKSLKKEANTFILVNEIIGKDPFVFHTSYSYDINVFTEAIKNQLSELNRLYPDLYPKYDEYEKIDVKKMKRTISLENGSKLYNFPENMYENETYLLSSLNKADQFPYLIYIHAKNEDVDEDVDIKVNKSNKLSDKYRNEKTWNGYDSDIMKSALQKYIRRGNLSKALYSAGELDLFKEAPARGETIRTNFLHRLMIIYLEDVENVSILEEVDKLINGIFKEKDVSLENRNVLKEEEMISRLVYILTKSKKARVCSHVRAVFNQKYNNKTMLSKYPSIKKLWDEINDNSGKDKYDLFKKYLKEKNILCVYYAFQIDMSDDKFGRKNAVWFIFEQLKNMRDIKDINIYSSWYKNHLGKMKEGFLCWLFPLLVHLSIISSDKDENEIKEEKYDKNWRKNRNMETIEIDDYVVDRHTKKGHDKDLVEFALIGAHVENEYDFVNPEWKSFYEDGKRYDENKPINIKKEKEDEKEIPLETDEYSFIVLTQITTSSSKMDVYFAKDKNDKLVVVKGPYQNRKDIDILIKNTNWKQKNNIPFIPFITKQMIPNRWPEGIPLGARNNVNRHIPSWFIIFDSMINKDEIITKTHSSKLWPETEVVDWSKIPLHFDYKNKLNKTEIKDYIHALLYRYIRGVPDLADRNFLVRKGHVISIDEDIENRDVNMYNELRKNKAEFVYNWINNNYDELDVKKWINIFKDDKFEKVQNKKDCLEIFKK